MQSFRVWPYNSASRTWPGWILFFFQAEDGIRDWSVTGVQTCALPISEPGRRGARMAIPGRSREGGVRPLPIRGCPGDSGGGCEALELDLRATARSGGDRKSVV